MMAGKVMELIKTTQINEIMVIGGLSGNTTMLHYLEKDVETAILSELESFILELGKGFAFVERQKRIIIDGEDFYIDLLFYHRTLKRLVAIELKLGKFQGLTL